jgi:hypothetical protein
MPPDVAALDRHDRKREEDMSHPLTDSSDPITHSICCPICEVRLEEIVLARPDDDYFCPWCCTQQKPGAASGLTW